MSWIARKNITLNNGEIVIIKTAEPKDSKGIIEVMKSVMREKIFTIHEIDEYKETAVSMSKKIRQYRKATGKIIMAALCKNRIIGYVTFNNWDARKTMHTGFLSIYLIREFRGIGLGKELMKILIGWGKANKLIRKMSLAVFSCNRNAIALYKKVGFKIEGLCPGDIKIKGKYYDSVFMYKFMN